MLSTLPALPTVSATPSAQSSPAPHAADGSEASHAFARQLQAAQGQDGDKHTDAADSAAQKPAGPPAKPARHTPPASGAKARIESADNSASQGPRAAAEADAAATEGSIAGRDASVSDAPDSAGPEANPQDLAALLAQLRGHSTAVDATPRAAAGLRLGQDGEAAEGLAGRGGKVGKAGKVAGSDATGSALDTTDAKATRPGAADPRDAAGSAVTRVFKDQADRALQDPLAGTGKATESQDAQASPAQSQAPADSSSFSAALASASALAGGAPASTGASASAPAQAQLPAALGSPDFAPQLGAQISTFVRDGIEHAQLHLNPAEMGPVTVQIQLDGQAAQVHLLADQPATRQALEQAMPQLAGSLREAGLTLTGGGVFQQPRQTGGDANGSEPGRNSSNSGSSRSRGATAAVQGLGSGLDAATRSAAQPRRRGVVDLVA